MTENKLPTIRVSIGGTFSEHTELQPAFIMLADAITTKRPNITVSFSHKNEVHTFDVENTELTTMQMLNSVLELFSQHYPFEHTYTAVIKKNFTDCYDDFFLNEEWLMLYMDDKPSEPFWCIHRTAGVITRMVKRGDENEDTLEYLIVVHSLKDASSLYEVLSDSDRYAIPLCGGKAVKFGHLDYFIVKDFKLATSITSGKWLYHMRTELKEDQGPWMIPNDNEYAPVISGHMLESILKPMGVELPDKWLSEEVPPHAFVDIPPGW